MPLVSVEKLAALQQNSQDIRNICILAHVDHGKTSLTDALIATNGIISPKLAGKIRYLDSRPDEQLRGITMESSAISLCFSMSRRTRPQVEAEQRDYLINLIDSPGHVDFSSEVSTASRLCDGAIVLVDAVEGVCSQTVTVLRQTWLEHMKPLLVINKIDRLIWELKMSATEAYTHLSRLVEEVNAVLGSFFQGERMEEDLHWRERVEERVSASVAKGHQRPQKDSAGAPGFGLSGDIHEVTCSTNGEFEERDDEELYFTPQNNNIIFSSAVDGWAFTVRQFAALYEKKLNIKRSVLEKFLWGDFYLDPKTKRVLSSKHLKGRVLKPMFVQLVLDNIWAVYESTTGGAKTKGDPITLEKITKSLSLTLPPHVLRAKDSRATLTAIFSSWLPLSTAVLVSVIEQLPSPPAAQAERLPRLIDKSPDSEYVSPEIRNAMIDFKSGAADPIVVYVSKMVSVPANELPENKRQAGGMLTAEEARDLARKRRTEIAKVKAASESQIKGADGLVGALENASIGQTGDADAAVEEESPEEPEQLIGFARLYSGRLAVGDSIYVLSPKYSPANPYAQPEPKQVKVTALYLLMGRALESLKAVPAGVVFGIGGLEGHILKSGTLCSQLTGGVNLAGMSMGNQPIVRVALEPNNPGDLAKMIHGMKLLEQSDPCALYEVMDSGEHVILTAGELHLERCLKDLRERFARCEIQAGEPIVPYRESIVKSEEMAPPRDKDLARGTVIGLTTSRHLTVRLRVRPLPAALTGFLSRHTNTIRRLYAERKAAEKSELKDIGRDEDDEVGLSVAGDESDVLTLDEFRKALTAALAENDDQPELWTHAVEKITAFGPKMVGPNVLIDVTKEEMCRRFLHETEDFKEVRERESTSSPSLSVTDFSDRISYGFQLAMAQGPLCNEPLQGVAVFLEDVHLAGSVLPEGKIAKDSMGRLTGEIIKTVRDSVRQGFLDWSPRLLLAMYSCEIQASTDVLGRVYGVITRRRGRILSEALHEGTPFFTVTALLPAAESFGFSDEIRKRTSGGASPQLRFCGFDNVLDQDPFWVPSTEDELEDLGQLADRDNVAKRYMDGVRRRKGLLVKGLKRTEGEKARTLKK